MRRLSLLAVLENCNDLSKQLQGLGQDELGDLSFTPDYGMADSAVYSPVSRNNLLIHLVNTLDFARIHWDIICGLRYMNISILTL